MIPRWRTAGVTLACAAGVATGIVPPAVQAERARPTRTAPRSEACRLHPGDVFEGRYLCRQGETDMHLEVLSVAGDAVRAAFGFTWRQGGITGRFTLNGRCEGATRRWVMRPEAWQSQPAGWVMVGMDGTLDPGDGRYHGRMVNPDCGGFDAVRR